MPHIKDKSKVDKVSVKSQVTRVPKICFGFEHLTTNSSYNFDYFAKDKSKKCIAYDELIIRLQELSQIDVVEARKRGKKLGFEKFSLKHFSKSIQQICSGIDIISSDSSLVVFQFCNHDFRLICKDDIMHPNLMYVIAFDFDFSAYNHE